MSLDQAALSAYSTLPVYKRRIEQAQGYIAEALKRCEYPYVAFSGGKDSSVMLHMVAEQKPDVEAQILTGGESRLLHNDLQNILDWWEKETSVNLIEVFIDMIYAPGWEDASFEEGYSQFCDGWNKYLHDKNHDGVFIGLRRQESGHRDILFRRFGAVHRYSEKRKDARAGTILCTPIQNLKTEDIMAYLVKKNIPTFDVYETGTERTKTRLGRTAMGLGQLADLRARDPVAFNTIVARFPELRRFGG